MRFVETIGLGEEMVNNLNSQGRVGNWKRYACSVFGKACQWRESEFFRNNPAAFPCVRGVLFSVPVENQAEILVYRHFCFMLYMS